MATKKVFVYWVDSPREKKTVMVYAANKREASRLVAEEMHHEPHVGIAIGKPAPLEEYVRKLLPRSTKLDNPIHAVAALQYVIEEYSEQLTPDQKKAMKGVIGTIFEAYTD